MDNKIIFSNSFSPRTGHNFVSEALKVFTNHKVLAHNRSELRVSIFLKAYYKFYNDWIFTQTDKDFFDELIIKDLREKLVNASGQEYTMIKSTTFQGLEFLQKVFPDDIHILVLRNPNDVFNSIFKAMDLRKPSFKNYIKKIGVFTGLYPYYYSKRECDKVIALIPSDLSKYDYILRYEDLVERKREVLQDLKTLFKSTKELDQIIEEMDKIRITNSSFYKEYGAKNIWDAKKMVKKFNPVNRKSHSFLVRLAIKLGTKKLSKKLNYVK